MSSCRLSEEMAIDCDANETSKPNLELKSILREYFENSDRAISNDLQYPGWSNLPLQVRPKKKWRAPPNLIYFTILELILIRAEQFVSVYLLYQGGIRERLCFFSSYKYASMLEDVKGCC